MDENFTYLIYKKLKGIISDKEFEELSSWLLESDDNLSYFQDISDAWTLPTSASEEEKEQAWKQLSQQLQLNTTPVIVPIAKQTNKFQWLKIAAAVLVLVGAYFFYDTVFQPATSTKIVETRDQKKMKLLPDGSIVWLNKNSSIQYASNFKKNRVVQLTGEAFFEVEKMNGQNFIVQSPSMEVKVLGTKFNVLDNNKGQEVSVTEGKVEVTISNETNQKITLVKSDKVTIDPTNLSLQKISAHHNELFWHTGDIYFNNTPLSEVSSIIERNFGVSVLLSPAIQDCLLSGQYNSAKAEDVIEDVKDIFGFTVDNYQNTWKIEGVSCQ